MTEPVAASGIDTVPAAPPAPAFEPPWPAPPLPARSPSPAPPAVPVSPATPSSPPLPAPARPPPLPASPAPARPLEPPAEDASSSGGEIVPAEPPPADAPPAPPFDVRPASAGPRPVEFNLHAATIARTAMPSRLGGESRIVQDPTRRCWTPTWHRVTRQCLKLGTAWVLSPLGLLGTYSAAALLHEQLVGRGLLARRGRDLRRRRAVDEDLVHRVVLDSGAREQARRLVDALDDDAGRGQEVLRGAAREGLRHEVDPDRQRRGRARGAAAERARLVEADPHGREQIGRVADEPGIDRLGRDRLATDDDLAVRRAGLAGGG